MKDVLGLLLPTRRETRLLESCLTGVGDPLEAILSGGPLSAAWPPLPIVPLLADAAARGDRGEDRAPERELARGLHAVRLRSEQRSRTVRRLLAGALEGLAAEGVNPLVLRGAALAETVYPQPALRHCHDLDLLIEPAEAPAAERALGAIGFAPDRSARRPAGAGPRLVHPSGLPLHLHHSAFRLAFHEPPAELFPGAGESASLGGRPARVLAPAEQLLHVLGHAASGSGRDTLRWACDAWFLLGARKDLEWDRFAHLAGRSRLELPLSVQLPWLRDALGAAVPEAIVERLARAAASPGADAREAALRAVLSGRRGTVASVLRRTSGMRARAEAARWIALPTPRAVRWTRPAIGAGGLALHYALRPVRGIARVARRIYPARRDSAASRIDTSA